MRTDVTDDDLEFLRDIADAGAHAPLLGGRFLVWWGGAITIAYGLHYGLMTGVIGPSPAWVGPMWMGLIALALIGYFVLGAVFPSDKPGAAAPGNRAKIVWMGAGFSIFAFFSGAVPAAYLGRISPDALTYSLPLVFAVYACALMVTGGLARDRTSLIAGWLAIVFVALTIFFVSTLEVYLIAMAGVFLCAFVPGIILLSAEPKSVV
ncbi:MAG: hypothetical protein AAGH87_03065 [Pseudomonadota bacterium]